MHCDKSHNSNCTFDCFKHLHSISSSVSSYNGIICKFFHILSISFFMEKFRLKKKKKEKLDFYSKQSSRKSLYWMSRWILHPKVYHFWVLHKWVHETRTGHKVWLFALKSSFVKGCLFSSSVLNRNLQTKSCKVMQTKQLHFLVIIFNYKRPKFYFHLSWCKVQIHWNKYSKHTDNRGLNTQITICKGKKVVTHLSAEL